MLLKDVIRENANLKLRIAQLRDAIERYWLAIPNNDWAFMALAQDEELAEKCKRPRIEIQNLIDAGFNGA